MQSDPSVNNADAHKTFLAAGGGEVPEPQPSTQSSGKSPIPSCRILYCLSLCYFTLSYSYWLTLLLAIPAGGLLTRTFIIFHDCGHGSFFKAQRANNFLGTICGLLVYTPYYQWRFEQRPFTTPPRRS